MLLEHSPAILSKIASKYSPEGEELEFSSGFTDLHTRVYESILGGFGFSLNEARQAIDIVHTIRNSKPIGLKGEYHPYARKKLGKHPFNFN